MAFIRKSAFAPAWMQMGIYDAHGYDYPPGALAPTFMSGMGAIGVKYRGAGGDWICRRWAGTVHPTATGIPVERLCDPSREVLTPAPLKPVVPRGPFGAGVARGVTPMQRHLQEQRRQQIVSRLPEASPAFFHEARRQAPGRAPFPSEVRQAPRARRVTVTRTGRVTPILTEIPPPRPAAAPPPPVAAPAPPRRAPAPFVPREVVTPAAPARGVVEAPAAPAAAVAWYKGVPWWAWLAVGGVAVAAFGGRRRRRRLS